MGHEALSSVQFLCSSREQKSEGQKAAPCKEFHSPWQGFGWDELALRKVQQEASVVLTSLEACERNSFVALCVPQMELSSMWKAHISTGFAGGLCVRKSFREARGSPCWTLVCSGSSRGPWSQSSMARQPPAGWSGRWPRIRSGSRTPNAWGAGVMSLVTVANRALTLRRLKVAPTARAVFAILLRFNAAGEALRSGRTPTTLWRPRTSSSLALGMSAPLTCCERRPDSPPDESSAQECTASGIKENDGTVTRQTA